MRIGVIGAGYVGLVASACLAAQGHNVICMDTDETRLSKLSQGILPYHEPGLGELVREQLRADTLHFTPDLPLAVKASEVVFIAVGTPSSEDGSVDLSAVTAVAQGIGAAAEGHLVVVIKSTVPVGTAELVQAKLAKHSGSVIAVLSNPEFLREGQAVQDFCAPDRIIIGGTDERALTLLRDLFAPFAEPERILSMDSPSAEMAKYTANAFLATRVSFVNEVASLCEELGADVERVREAIGLDPRIGPAYLSPGLGYGGSCLPKDLRALLATGRQRNVTLDLLNAVQQVNSRQPERLCQKILDHFEGTLCGRHITIWGLAFKGGTDDLRETPAIPLLRALLKAGALVTAYDPQANGSARLLLGDEVSFSNEQYSSLLGAEALVIATDWDAFRDADLAQMRSMMANPLIFDGRNIYDPKVMWEHGFTYFGVGRPLSAAKQAVPVGETLVNSSSSGT